VLALWRGYERSCREPGRFPRRSAARIGASSHARSGWTSTAMSRPTISSEMAFIAKPFTTRALLEKARAVLGAARAG